MKGVICRGVLCIAQKVSLGLLEGEMPVVEQPAANEIGAAAHGGECGNLP